MSDSAREQRTELIRVQEENNRLKMQLEASDRISENFKIKMAKLHDAGRRALETAKKEAKKNQLLKQEIQETKQLLVMSTNEQRKMSLEIQNLKLLEEEKDDLAQQLRKSNTSMKMLEKEVIEIEMHGKSTNMSLVRELDEMRRSFHDFLQQSKEQVGDIKRSSASVAFEKGCSSW